MLCNELFNFMHISLIYFIMCTKNEESVKYEIYYFHYYCFVYLLVVCATVNIYINQKYMNGYLV